MPSTTLRGATISQMSIPSCCSLPPHLVVAVRSTEDDVRLHIEINLLVMISVLVLIHNDPIQSLTCRIPCSFCRDVKTITIMDAIALQKSHEDKYIINITHGPQTQKTNM